MKILHSNSRFAGAALLLACLIGTAIAQQTQAPSDLDTLDLAVVPGAQGRERPDIHSPMVGVPDVVIVTRRGRTQVAMEFADYPSHVDFRRESSSRVPSDAVHGRLEMQRDHNVESQLVEHSRLVHQPTENAIRKSGLGFTILRHALHADILVGDLQHTLASGALRRCGGDARCAYVARADLGVSAAQILMRDQPAGRTYSETMERAYSGAEIAALMTEVFGKPCVTKPSRPRTGRAT